MKKKFAFQVLAMVATVSASAMISSPAEAYITRATCSRPTDGASMGKMMGNRNAKRLVNALWNKLGRRCDQLDRLAQILSETPLAQPYRGGTFAACFYMGYTDSVWDELDQVYERCGVKCFSAGAEIGRISAEGYCWASIAVGGLDDPGFIRQPPLPFCGMNISLGCKSEYVTTASFDIDACYPYTVGSFESIFENSVRQDCFVPSDVPIADGGWIGANW